MTNTIGQPDELKKYPFIYTQLVIWNDMDALSHVNNVVYYRYAESARIDYLTQVGGFFKGVNVVLAQSSCQYLVPVFFPDTLLIGVRTIKVGNTSMIMDYCYYSTAQQKVVAKGETVLVRLNEDSSAKVAWTEEERTKIATFEGQVGNVLS